MAKELLMNAAAAEKLVLPKSDHRQHWQLEPNRETDTLKSQSFSPEQGISLSPKGLSTHAVTIALSGEIDQHHQPQETQQ